MTTKNTHPVSTAGVKTVAKADCPLCRDTGWIDDMGPYDPGVGACGDVRQCPGCAHREDPLEAMRGLLVEVSDVLSHYDHHLELMLESPANETEREYLERMAGRVAELRARL